MLCISAAYAIMRCCMSVPVTFVHSVKIDKRIFNFFSPSGSHTFLVFPYQTSWQYSDGNLFNGGVEYRWGRQKWRFQPISCSTACWSTATAKCYQHGAGEPGQVVTLVADSKRRNLLMAGDNDELFMTRSFNVTPKTTEQHLIDTQ